MGCEYYLTGDSFHVIDSSKLEVIIKKLKELAAVCGKIRYENEKISKNGTLYNKIIIKRYTIIDVLYNATVSINRDLKKSLILIIDRAKYIDETDEKVIEIIINHNSNKQAGLLCLYEIRELPQELLVMTFNDWYRIHQYFLSCYPGDTLSFFNSCRQYFPKVYFHSNVQHSLTELEGGLNNFTKTIIECLKSLNDDFQKDCLTKNRIESLRKFSSAIGLEVTCEGDAQRKKQFTFRFYNDEGIEEPVCCEPHIKLGSSDINGDTHYYNNRIYFHEGKSHIREGKVLIGHIGKHL